MVQMQTKNAARLFSLFSASLMVGLPALAAAGERPAYYHDMMWGGWGWAGMVLGPITMIAVLAAVVVVVVLIVRWLGGGYMAPQAKPQNTALAILRERFARGEIDKDEFEQKRDLLSD